MKPKDTEKLLELLKKPAALMLPPGKQGFSVRLQYQGISEGADPGKGITIVQLASDAQLSERYCFQPCLSPTHAIHPGMFC
ncbi:MAG: hypothetical protein ACLUOF_00470 [Ruminococcus sp.]